MRSGSKLTKICLFPVLSTVVFIFYFYGTHIAGGTEWAVVDWVNDGDTVILTDGRHVRYLGINAPEIAHKNTPAEPFGYEARRINYGLVHGKSIRMELGNEKKDRYGRYLAYVFLTDGTFVNGKLLSLGFAHVLKTDPNTRYEKELLACQREAMKSCRGLWKQWQNQSGPFVGNRRSNRFHRPGCPYEKRIAQSNRVNFPTAWQALWDGYAPGKKCKFR